MLDVDREAAALLSACEMEIERKFLISETPVATAGADTSTITQGYLTAGPDVEVRVRRIDETCVLTVKGQGDLARVEEEFPIGRHSFESLWPLTGTRHIEKVRRRIPFGDHLIELDVFGGRLVGLMIAEVEFPTEAAAAAFEPPDWFGREVTADRRYHNAWLAQHGRPDESAADPVTPPSV